MDIRLEKFKFKYYKECVDILGEEWDLGKTSAEIKGNISARIYMLEILMYSTEIIVCLDNKKVIGFAGYDKYSDKRDWLKKKFISFVRKLMFYSHKIKHRDKLIEYYDAYSYTPESLIGKFDGELIMLITRNEYREQGIGSKLFNTICKMARENNVKKISIDTGDSCNWNFYERNDCKRVYETYIENGEMIKEKAYIYEKIL